MNIISVPASLTALPALAADVSGEVRARVGAGPLTLSVRVVETSPAPMPLTEFYNLSGRLYAVRFNLPPGSRERTARRTGLLTGLLCRALNASGGAVMEADNER